MLQEKDSITKAEVSRYLLQNDAYSGLRAQRLASDNTWRYFAYDIQGSTRKLLNSDGSSALDLLFRAFGQKQASSGAGSTLMQFGAFWGYEWDADSRMWVKARHLSGTQGRWLSQDPIGFGGGDWNLWRYVGNNPIIGIDPRGLLNCSCCNSFFAWAWCCDLDCGIPAPKPPVAPPITPKPGGNPNPAPTACPTPYPYPTECRKGECFGCNQAFFDACIKAPSRPDAKKTCYEILTACQAEVCTPKLNEDATGETGIRMPVQLHGCWKKYGFLNSFFS